VAVWGVWGGGKDSGRGGWHEHRAAVTVSQQITHDMTRGDRDNNKWQAVEASGGWPLECWKVGAAAQIIKREIQIESESTIRRPVTDDTRRCVRIRMGGWISACVPDRQQYQCRYAPSHVHWVRLAVMAAMLWCDRRESPAGHTIKPTRCEWWWRAIPVSRDVRRCLSYEIELFWESGFNVMTLKFRTFDVLNADRAIVTRWAEDFLNGGRRSHFLRCITSKQQREIST